MRKLSILGACCALLLATDSDAARLQPGQQVWEQTADPSSRKSAVDNAAEHVWQQLQGGDGAAALASLQASGDVLQQHWVLHEVLRRLLASTPMAAAEPLLAYAEAQPVRIVRRHEETAADWFLPMFDPAAGAADVRRAWRITTLREGFAAALTQKRALPEIAGDADADTLAALAATIEAASAAQIDALMRDLHSRPAAAKRGVAVTTRLALARRSGDTELVADLFGDADRAVRLAAFEQVLPVLDVAQQRNWLLRLEGDAELASAATLALVPQLVRDGDTAALLQRLDDESRRASAATALAGLDDALQWIDRLWGAAATSRQRRSLLLALTLHDSPEARQRRDALKVSMEATR